MTRPTRKNCSPKTDKKSPTVPAVKPNRTEDKSDGLKSVRQASSSLSALTASSQHGRSFADALRNLAKNAEEDKVIERVSPSVPSKVSKGD